MSIALSVLGASGKMGRRILHLAMKDPLFRIAGGAARGDEHPTIGSLVGDGGMQAPISSDPVSALADCDVAIDFTSHEATRDYLRAAVERNKPLVIGTTGHSLEGKKAIEEAAKLIPILFSPNFSFGIALCLDAVSRFGKALYGSCAIDIIETHHVHKKDRPSGTAFAFAGAVGNGKIALENASAQPRKKEEIVIHSIRSGEIIGEHAIVFECGHERIELKHTAHTRDAFAQGALMGAKFLVNKSPGLYSLKDMFI